MINQFLVASFIGFVMGVLTHTKRNKHIKMPRINKASWNPGFLLDSSFGAVASLVGVLVSSPTELERVILIAILAGYAGEGFINKLSEGNFDKNIYNDRKVKADLEKDLNNSSKD